MTVMGLIVTKVGGSLPSLQNQPVVNPSLTVLHRHATVANHFTTVLNNFCTVELSFLTVGF